MLELFMIMSVVSILAYTINALEKRQEKGKKKQHRLHSWSTSVIDGKMYCLECNYRNDVG